VQMNMVFAHNSFQNAHVQCITRLPQQVPAAQLHCTTPKKLDSLAGRIKQYGDV
jgi:hypothetical protein